jgi:hypothetical protein
MRVYSGRIVRGHGHARENYKVMIPEIAKDFPSVADCGLFGTINVRLDRTFDHSSADHWTPRIAWWPVVGLPGPRVEAFGFIKIEFQFCAQQYDAWIIRPQGHPWTYDGAGVKIITDKKIPGVSYGDACSLHLDHDPSGPRPYWFR